MALPILSYVDRCIFTAASNGIGTFTVAGAVLGFQTPVAAGAISGNQYGYAAQSTDLTQWEYGYGTLTISGGVTTLTRTVIAGTNGTSPVNFSVAPQVLLSVLAESLATFLTQITINTTTISGGTTGRVVYDNAGVTGEAALTALIDSNFGSAQGDILYRGASAWTVLAPGTSGFVLQTSGAAANPVWAASSGSITINTTTISGGNNGHVLFDNSGTVGEATLFTILSGNPNAGQAYLFQGNPAIYGSLPNHDWFDGGSGPGPTSIGSSGGGNLGTGVGALGSLTSGANNVAFGPNALGQLTTGTLNVAIGTDSLHTLQTGSHNLAVGADALFFCTTGSQNTAIGRAALENLTTGQNNTAIGEQALFNVVSTSSNVGIGAASLQNCTGSNCIGIGDSAGAALTASNYNVYIGTQAGAAVTLGNHNTCVGPLAMPSNPGSANTMIGFEAGFNITSGNNNTLLGVWPGPAGALSGAVALSDGAGTLWLDYNATTSGFWTFAAPPVVPGYAVGSLPGGTVGAIARVTDGTAGLVNGNVVTGGHSTPYLVWYNGTNWTVVGE